MKYNWNINYVKCLEYRLNLSEWAVVDLLWHLPTWAEWKEIEWEIYFYLSTKKMTEELPVISDKPNTFLKLLCSLKSKDLVNHKIIWNKGYYKLTDKWKSFFVKLFDSEDEGMEKNPYKCGKKSILCVEKNPYNNNTSNNITSNNSSSNNTILQKFKEFLENEETKNTATAETLKVFFSLWFYTTESVEEFKKWLKEKVVEKYFNYQGGLAKFLNELEKFRLHYSNAENIWKCKNHKLRLINWVEISLKPKKYAPTPK